MVTDGELGVLAWKLFISIVEAGEVLAKTGGETKLDRGGVALGATPGRLIAERGGRPAEDDTKPFR